MYLKRKKKQLQMSRFHKCNIKMNDVKCNYNFMLVLMYIITTVNITQSISNINIQSIDMEIAIINNWKNPIPNQIFFETITIPVHHSLPLN